MKRRIRDHLYDESGGDGGESAVAIYSLSDPRNLRAIRYVGQTRSPRKRLLQHWNTARLWLPDELPWWIQSPKMRPLYHWIRELYRDEGRLPVMVVRAWTLPHEARFTERTHIMAALQMDQALLNFESELLQAQLVLL